MLLHSIRRLGCQTWIAWRRVATAVEVPPVGRREFPPESKRTGAIAIKAGMTQDWDAHGAFVPLTVLWIDNCQVTNVRQKENGEIRLQLGCGFEKEKNVPTHEKRKFDQLGMPIKSKLAEFTVTEDAVLPVGTSVTAAHFVPGQYVDVKGTTIGKGFQGVMKRWGFAGGNASHGASKSHRSAGSIGACQDPGKVWKGKKMAGHMGCKTRVVHSVWVYKVDPSRNLIYVRGQVPGHKGDLYATSVEINERMFAAGPVPEIGVAEPERDPYHLFQKGKL